MGMNLHETRVLEYPTKASCEKLEMFTTHPQAKTKITKQRVRVAKPAEGMKYSLDIAQSI